MNHSNNANQGGVAGGSALDKHSDQIVSKYAIVLRSSQWIKDLLEFTKVFPITPDVGVNLNSPVFEIDKKDVQTVCLQYKLEESYADTRSHLPFCDSKRILHLGPVLTLVVSKDGNGEKAVFRSSLCECRACSRILNTLELEPICKIVKFTYKNVELSAEITFYPGVTDNFDMKRELYFSAPQNIVYFSRFFKIVNSKLTFPPSQNPLKIYSMPESLMTNEWTPPTIEGHLKPDMELVSSDGKYFPCHKCILTARSQFLAELMVAKPAGPDVKLYVSEKSRVVIVFLKYVYFRTRVGPLKQLDFESCVGTLKLACQYQLIDLIGALSRIVKEKMEAVSPLQLKVVRDIHKFLETMDKFQIVVRLHQRLGPEVKMLYQRLKDAAEFQTSILNQ